ncbi:hypothetical protein BU17DRAFT_66597 [Hysterangium stoloniferum]|nr:hypothetical protein BU17DRAFT_66597 [Hysterangium stoloniferum]
MTLLKLLYIWLLPLADPITVPPYRRSKPSVKRIRRTAVTLELDTASCTWAHRRPCKGRVYCLAMDIASESSLLRTGKLLELFSERKIRESATWYDQRASNWERDGFYTMKIVCTLSEDSDDTIIIIEKHEFYEESLWYSGTSRGRRNVLRVPFTSWINPHESWTRTFIRVIQELEDFEKR